VGQTVTFPERIRLAEVNTPERGKPGYTAATAFTAQWLARGPFQLHTCGREPAFKRILAHVYREDSDLSQELFLNRLAAPYRQR
jgi:endonuclease YncB( thermonuclease family)